jgi:hypothetical protein
MPFDTGYRRSPADRLFDAFVIVFGVAFIIFILWLLLG